MFESFAEICLLFAKMRAVRGHECLEAGHLKAEARRGAWLNGIRIRSIK